MFLGFTVVDSLLLVLYGVELLELCPVLLLDAVDQLPHQRHDYRVLRRAEAVLDGEREEEGEDLRRDRLLRQAQLVVVHGHLVDPC